MKRYIKYSILFFGLIVIIDLISGVILKKQFDHIKFGDYSTINKSINTNAEILILGSSRAVHHYNAKIISEATKKKAYNAGFGGHGLFLNYAILNELINKKCTPKIVLLDLAPNIIVDKEAYSKLSLLLPYYDYYSSFKEIIQLNPEFSKIELVSNLYVYNSTLYDILKSYIVKREGEVGFAALEGQINEVNFNPFFLENEKMDNNKIIYLNKLINLCKINNIKLIGIVSPTYLKFDQKNRIINKLKTIFYKKNIEFHDYSIDTNFYQKKVFFKDQLHLNGVGANIFSSNLIEKLKLLN